MIKFKNINKPLVVTIICVLVLGISVGGVISWLLTKNYYERQKLAIVESLEDDFWSNGFATGDNTTVGESQADITEQSETQTKTPQITAEKTTVQRQTVPYGGHEFVLNTSSKKIHTPDCAAVKTIKPENYAETDDFVGALASGYVQCKQCYPIDN